jgi:bacterioferritin
MHEKSIDLLNQAMADELAAIHQYMYFHFHCDDQGYDPLANLLRQTAIQEMQHAERVAERILFLKGEVTMVPNASVENIHDIGKMLAKAKEMEEATIKLYNGFAIQCSQHGDSVSKQLFESLVVAEEGHFDNFDTQEEHLQKFGEQFLALQSIERSRQISGGQGAEGA